jgi:hypothetical protein
MTSRTGRGAKRTPQVIAVELYSAEHPEHRERTFTENVSAIGARVVSSRSWRPGERVVISSDLDTVRRVARVVYCQPLSDRRFAVGLHVERSPLPWDGELPNT